MWVTECVSIPFAFNVARVLFRLYCQIKWNGTETSMTIIFHREYSSSFFTSSYDSLNLKKWPRREILTKCYCSYLMLARPQLLFEWIVLFSALPMVSNLPALVPLWYLFIWHWLKKANVSIPMNFNSISLVIVHNDKKRAICSFVCSRICC